jgi:hypothetical protein
LSANELCPTPCPFLTWCRTVVCGTVNVSVVVWDSLPRQSLIVTRNSHVTELVKFDAKYSCYSGMYCLKITKPCNFIVMLSTTKCFDWF